MDNQPIILTLTIIEDKNINLHLNSYFISSIPEFRDICRNIIINVKTVAAEPAAYLKSAADSVLHVKSKNFPFLALFLFLIYHPLILIIMFLLWWPSIFWASNTTSTTTFPTTLSAILTNSMPFNFPVISIILCDLFTGNNNKNTMKLTSILDNDDDGGSNSNKNKRIYNFIWWRDEIS